MAKCEKREIKPEPPPVEYVLTLTENEARQLRWATTGYSSAGDAYCIPVINGALAGAGVGDWSPK